MRAWSVVFVSVPALKSDPSIRRYFFAPSFVTRAHGDARFRLLIPANAPEAKSDFLLVGIFFCSSMLAYLKIIRPVRGLLRDYQLDSQPGHLAGRPRPLLIVRLHEPLRGQPATPLSYASIASAFETEV